MTLTARQALGPGDLTVTLQCLRRDERTVSNVSVARGRGLSVGAERRASTRPVWEGSIQVGSGLTLPAGAHRIDEFAIEVPDVADPTADPTIPDWARGAVAVIDAVSMRHRELVWRVKARFTNPAGFDLRCTEAIHVNPSPTG